jgi:CBS domain-containing protein
MYVRSLLKSKGSDVITTNPDETVEATARLLTANRIGAVVVCDEGRSLVGIISERDIVQGMAETGGAVCGRHVRDLMKTEVRTCAPEDSITEIMSIMTTRRIRHLPVVEDGVLVGIISIGDVVKHRLEEIESEVEGLRDYVLGGR